MNPDEALARATAKATVQETFLALGVDISTPAGVLRTQHNFAFLDALRTNTAKLRFYATTVVILVTLTTIGAAIAHVLAVTR